MMKHTFVALVLMTFAAGSAWAQVSPKKKASPQQQTSEREPASKKKALADEASGQGYGMAGCGLGSIVFGEKEGPVQIFAATTNDFYSNNTFGMTSGTSNCDSYKDMAAIQFIDSYRFTLENDIVRGEGESLSALSKVMECPTDLETLRSERETIFVREANARQIYFTLRQRLSCEG